MKKLLTLIIAVLAITACSQKVQVKNELKIKELSTTEIDGSMYEALVLFMSDKDELVGSTPLGIIKPNTASEAVTVPNNTAYFLVRWQPISKDSDSMMTQFLFFTKEKCYVSETVTTLLTINGQTSTRMTIK